MCYGDHLDADRDLSIDDVVGKLAEDVSPRACLKVGPDRGRARDQSDRPVHFPNKCLGRPAALLKVPFKGFIDFPESFQGELNLGAAHSASPGTGLGSPPKGWSSLPLLPTQLPEQQLPGATPSRHPLPAQAPSSPTGHPRSQPVHRRANSAPLEVGSRLFSCELFYHIRRTREHRQEPEECHPNPEARAPLGTPASRRHPRDSEAEGPTLLEGKRERNGGSGGTRPVAGRHGAGVWAVILAHECLLTDNAPARQLSPSTPARMALIRSRQCR